MTYEPPKHKRVKIEEVKLKSAFGRVDDPPYKRKITIRIDPRQKQNTRLDTLIHEWIHLFDPEMKETRVRKMGTYLAKALWKEGYRKQSL